MGGGGWGEGLSSRPLDKGGDLQKAPGLSLVLKIIGGGPSAPLLWIRLWETGYVEWLLAGRNGVTIYTVTYRIFKV